MVIVLILFVTARVLGGRKPGELTRRQKRRIDREARRAEAVARAARPAGAVGPAMARTASAPAHPTVPLPGNG
jgi:phosphate transport system permease protein